MSSSYSTDLRIELIGNGEQSGVWGTTTNNNLGVLIEDAIAGLANVSITASSQALTAFYGASDQARCAALMFNTGVWANAFNIFAPPVTKLYAIKNNTPYGASLYCSTVIGNTTAAGAGLDIPAGKAVFVRSNGIQFFDVVDHISGNLDVDGSLTLGTALAVAEGGTGLSTIPARSIPVANVLDTLTTITPAANQSIRINSAGTAWEAYTPSGGGGTVTQIVAGTGLSGGTITTSGTIALANTAVSAGTYGNSTNVAQITVDAQGRITSATNVAVSGGGGGVTSISASPPLSASASTGSVTLSTPQSIGTASSVQFGSFGVGTAASGTSGEIRATNNVTAYYSDARLRAPPEVPVKLSLKFLAA